MDERALDSTRGPAGLRDPVDGAAGLHGDHVVTDGVSKVRDGATVQPQLEKVNTEGV